jgi:hypothetical protein
MQVSLRARACINSLLPVPGCSRRLPTLSLSRSFSPSLSLSLPLSLSLSLSLCVCMSVCCVLRVLLLTRCLRMDVLPLLQGQTQRRQATQRSSSHRPCSAPQRTTTTTAQLDALLSSVTPVGTPDIDGGDGGDGDDHYGDDGDAEAAPAAMARASGVRARGRPSSKCRPRVDRPAGPPTVGTDTQSIPAHTDPLDRVSQHEITGCFMRGVRRRAAPLAVAVCLPVCRRRAGAVPLAPTPPQPSDRGGGPDTRMQLSVDSALRSPHAPCDQASRALVFDLRDPRPPLSRQVVARSCRLRWGSWSAAPAPRSAVCAARDGCCAPLPRARACHKARGPRALL